MDKPTAPRSEDGLPSEDVLRRLRVPLIRRAKLSWGEHHEDVFVVDLALSGVFVERPSALPVGTRVELSFPLPGNEIPIVADCRVAWCHPGEPGDPSALPPGIGLDFIGVAGDGAARVRGYLTEYYRREPRSRRFVSHDSVRRNEGGS